MTTTKEGEKIARCFFANRPCDRVVGRQSDVVFIAAPSADDHHFEVAAAQAIVTQAGLVPQVAVHRQVLSEDIFCEKICTNIIECRFCLLFLNGANPNVMYEYGLMRPLRKKVISLQRQEDRPPFNVQHLDTVRYRQADLDEKLADAVTSAASATQAKPMKLRPRSATRPESPFAVKIWKLLEIDGLSMSVEPWLEEVVEGTGFRALTGRDGPCLSSVFEAEWRIDEVVTDVLLLTTRLERRYAQVQSVVRVRRAKGWAKSLSDDQARADAIGRVRILLATPYGAANEDLLRITGAVSAKGISYPLPKVDIWTSEFVEERMRAV